MKAVLPSFVLVSFALFTPSFASAAQIRQVDISIPVASQKSANLGALVQSIRGNEEARSGDKNTLEKSLKSNMGLDEKSSLDLVKTTKIKKGTVLRYNQTYDGIPIWGQQIVVHQKEGNVPLNITGTAIYNIVSKNNIRTELITPKEAIAIAKELKIKHANLKGQTYRNEEAKLMYFLDKKGDLRLVYKVSFVTISEGKEGILSPTRPIFFIDAKNKDVVDTFENIQHQREGKGPGGNPKVGKTQYGTGTFPFLDITSNNMRCSMVNENVTTISLDNHSDAAETPFEYACYTNLFKEVNGGYSPLNDAHFFGEVVFDMYKDWYAINPLDQRLIMKVHYLVGYENAFWDGTCMTFGDGKETFYPLTALDIVAHEVSHGFTERNSGLIYRGQSGAINEAFSDMAGEAAEYYYHQKYGEQFNRPMPDFRVGADVIKKPAGSLRDMCNPTSDGSSIDTARDYYEGMDVHYSSGVFNKAFCVLSKRPQWNLKKAFDVFVAANQNFWVPNSTFESAAAGVAKAAITLGYEGNDVVEAFKSVGVTVTLQDPKQKLRKTKKSKKHV